MSIPSTGLGDDERLVVSPRRARHLLDCGNTRLYELLKNKELESYVDGRSRKIVTASIHRYIAQRLKEADSSAASAPVARVAPGGRMAKVRSDERAS
jgi:excisionase family DNA binding protein